MPISDTYVRLSPYPDRPEVLATVSFTVGPFRVRGCRVVEHGDNKVRLHMPDAPKTRRCGRCGRLVGVLHRFCHGCGCGQPKRPVAPDRKGRSIASREVVTFENHEDRSAVERVILASYLEALGVRPRLFVPAVGA